MHCLMTFTGSWFTVGEMKEQEADFPRVTEVHAMHRGLDPGLRDLRVHVLPTMANSSRIASI